MRTRFTIRPPAGCTGLIHNFSVIPDPPRSRNDGSPPETSSLETLPSSRESHANLSFRAVLAVDGDRKVRVVIGAAAAGISSEAAEAQRSRLLPKTRPPT